MLEERLSEAPQAKETLDKLLEQGKRHLDQKDDEQLRDLLMKYQADPEKLESPDRLWAETDRKRARAAGREELLERLSEFWENQLKGLLEFLAAPLRIQIPLIREVTPAEEIKDVERQTENASTKEVVLRGMDNWETAIEGFREPKDIYRFDQKLRTLVTKLRENAAELRKLQKTRVVRRALREDNLADSREYMILPDRLDTCAAETERYRKDFFRKVCEYVKSAGPQKRPQFKKQLANIFALVKDFTGSDQDTKLSVIISPFFDQHVEPDALRKLRERMDLK